MSSNRDNPDQVAECESVGGDEHPTPEQLLFRMAVDKLLNREQRMIWEYYNYDMLTTVEIAKKMYVSQQNISKRIKVIEAKLFRWCKENMEVYNTLKGAMENANLR